MGINITGVSILLDFVSASQSNTIFDLEAEHSDVTILF